MIRQRNISQACNRISDKKRNEPRDPYDLWYLAEHGHVQIEDTLTGVARKLLFREMPLDDIVGRILAKEPRLRPLWEKRHSYQMLSLPHFDAVFRDVKRLLKASSLSGLGVGIEGIKRVGTWWDRVFDFSEERWVNFTNPGPISASLAH
jgi:hypothetical protein